MERHIAHGHFQSPLSPNTLATTIRWAKMGLSQSRETPHDALIDKTDQIIDRLVRIKEIGDGGFGKVYLTADPQDPKVCYAKKIVNFSRSLKVMNDIKNEAQLQLLVGDHENILKLVNHRYYSDYYELYFEYIEDRDLEYKLMDTNGLPPPMAQHYFRQLIAGVDYMHSKKVVHRDIKPENILITKQDVVKICDFGGAANLYDSFGRENWFIDRLGTRAYCAPEMQYGKRYRGIPVDIWSCGIVLIVMLGGEFPWEKPPKSQRHWRHCVSRNDYKRRPWCRFQVEELSLIRMMLPFQPSERASTQRIMQHPWLSADLSHLSSFVRPMKVEPKHKRSVSQQAGLRYFQAEKQVRKFQSINCNIIMFFLFLLWNCVDGVYSFK